MTPFCLQLLPLVVATVVLAGAASPSPTDDPGSSAQTQTTLDSFHAVFHDRDVLDYILDRIPHRHLPVFDRLSADHIRLRRLLDPTLPARYLTPTIKNLARWYERPSEIVCKVDWEAALHLTDRLLALRSSDLAALVELARHLVRDLGLDKVGVLLPVDALRLECDPAIVAQLLSLSDGGDCDVTLPDHVTDCVNSAVNDVLITQLGLQVCSGPCQTDSEAVLAEWRQRPSLYSDRTQREEILRALCYRVQQEKPAISAQIESDLRQLYRMCWCGVRRWHPAQTDPHPVLMAICQRIPPPYHFIFCHPTSVASNLLRRLSDADLTDYQTLLSLRRVGIAFRCDLYHSRMHDVVVDYGRIVPLLDNSAATDLAVTLLETKQYELLKLLCDVPGFGTHLDSKDTNWISYLKLSAAQPSGALLRFLERFPSMGSVFARQLHSRMCSLKPDVCLHNPDLYLVQFMITHSTPELTRNPRSSVLAPPLPIRGPAARLFEYELEDPFMSNDDLDFFPY